MSQMEPRPMPEEEQEPEPEVALVPGASPDPQPEPEVEFHLKFEGQLNQIDASTLGYSLIHVTTVIREISEDLPARIDIKVKSTEPGSFIVRLALGALSDPLFQAQVAAAAPLGLTVLKTFTELFKLRKLLKGEPPKSIHVEGDYYEIRASDNTTINIEKPTYKAYFANPRVNEALAKTFEALKRDSYVDGFEITDDKEHPLFEAQRSDFGEMALTTSVPESRAKAITEDVHVNIVKPSFERKLKWDLVYRGIKIHAQMVDEEFLQRIDHGEQFAKGDVLRVFIEIDQELDDTVGAYFNKSYRVRKVLQHIPRPKQPNLLLES